MRKHKNIFSTPYVYAMNNPIKFIDTDGKEICIVNTSWAIIKAQKNMLTTESGKQLWDKYSNSTTHDIYITVQNQGEGQYGVTVFNINVLGLLRNNKIKLDLKNDVYKDFSSINNLDVSKSEGRTISLISFNETTMSKASNTRNAKTFFHELKGHIDLAIGGKRTKDNLDKEHKRLGVEYNTDSKGQTTETIIPNSPMDIFNKELEQNSDKEKKEYEEKMN